MTIEVCVPALPESVTDATVVTWHKQPGEAVRQDENLLDLETDKVVLEIPAPESGVLGEHVVQEGAVVVAGDKLTIIQSADAAVSESVVEREVAPTDAQASSADEALVLTPGVRRMVKEQNLDPAQIPGTGREGRIQKHDVMAYLDRQKETESVPSSDKAPDTHPSVEATVMDAGRQDKRVPMSRLRARIAERLLEAQQTAAILTTFNEVDLSQVIQLRRQYKEVFHQSYDVRLGFMSFFVKAVIEGLKKFPVVNASVEGTEIVYHNYYDIGIAVGSPRGLVVPIIRNADQSSFAELEQAIRVYGEKAQQGSLGYDELSGGTFTITNGGVYGSMLSTPILNPPQSAILGMHNIVERPVAIDGEIHIRPMMYVALSYDHRIIDGRDAVQFLVTIKQSLEEPARLLLAV